MYKIAVFEVHFEDVDETISNQQLIEIAKEQLHKSLQDEKCDPSYLVIDVDEYGEHLNDMAGDSDILTMGGIYEEENEENETL
jgi:hypothetical protein